MHHLLEIGLIRDASEITWIRAVSGDWCWPPNWWKSGNGAWGCLMSHLRVVQDAIMDGLESYMVLEDDAVFQPRSVEMLKRLMEEVPDDWEQIYLGGQHLKEPEAVEGNPFVLRCHNVNRTHCYILRRRAFARFQQHIISAPDYIAHPGWHIDHLLGIAHERGDWKVYGPAWWICGQEAGSSNISGRINPRMWWHPPNYKWQLPFIFVAAGLNLNSTPEDSPLLHFGNNCHPGTYQDRGLDGIQRNVERLRNWLEMIAQEALDMEKLPAISHPDLSLELLQPLWPGGVRLLEEIPVKEWADYPWNGLFSHPLNKSDEAVALVECINAA